MDAQVRCGPRACAAGPQWVGKTVEELRKFLARDLQIVPGMLATVSRFGAPAEPVQEDYRLKGGDLLEFVRPAGTKGL